MHRFFLLVLSCCFSLALSAQDSYRITVNIDGYEAEILKLANNVLDKQYLVDTAYRAPDGSYVFSSDTASLPAGIYLVVTEPDNSYFQILINDDDQQFTVNTKIDKLNEITVEGDEDNAVFTAYVRYLNAQQAKGQELSAMLADSTLSAEKKAEVQQEAEALDLAVKEHQQGILDKYPNSFSSLIIRTNMGTTPPDFPEMADQEKKREAQFRWLQDHYFDNIDLQDDRLLRTPFLFQRLNYYTDRLTVQIPDTISQSIDKVLDLMDPQSETYKYYVVHFTNKAANSKIVGMDAVYVHMVDAYYSSGKATWADAEQLSKMKENADEIRPLLVGKIAPDLKMKTRDGEDVTLHGLSADYTILYFWAFDCGHCKKSTPVMAEFYEKWHDKGVEIFSICTKQREVEKCWEYIDEKKIGDWMHVTDKYLRFYRDYSIKSTPTIFVLDENKKIISKRIGAEQLDEVLTMFEQRKAAEAAAGK